MTEQSMKILKMLEEGKITVDEAQELLSSVQQPEAASETEQPHPGSHPHPRPPRPPHGPGRHGFTIPEIEIPDVGKIVSDAMNSAFGQGFGPGSEHGFPFEAGAIGKMRYKGAKLDGAILGHTDLEGAQMEGARLEGADLRYADFSGADLRDADLRGGVFKYSDFSGANLRNADLRGCAFTYGDYSNANFSDANLQGSDFSYSELCDADFEGVEQHAMSLRGISMPGLKYEAGDLIHDETDDEEAKQRAQEAREHARDVAARTRAEVIGKAAEAEEPAHEEPEAHEEEQVDEGEEYRTT